MLYLPKEFSVNIKLNHIVPNENYSRYIFQSKTRKTKKDSRKLRNIISKYYSTHGTCAHSSKSYLNQAKVHKTEAMFQDKMNRSLERYE